MLRGVGPTRPSYTDTFSSMLRGVGPTRPSYTDTFSSMLRAVGPTRPSYTDNCLGRMPFKHVPLWDLAALLEKCGFPLICLKTKFFNYNYGRVSSHPGVGGYAEAKETQHFCKTESWYPNQTREQRWRQMPKVLKYEMKTCWLNCFHMRTSAQVATIQGVTIYTSWCIVQRSLKYEKRQSIELNIINFRP